MSYVKVFCAFLSAVACAISYADSEKELINLASSSALESIKPASSQVTVERSTDSENKGIVVTFAPGSDGYPGLDILPSQGATWDLSDYGHVALTVKNIGEGGVPISLRIDNAGDWKKSPWNTESTNLKPGESKTITVIFGYSYGKKPSYKLNSAEIIKALIFTSKVKSEKKILIESLVAAGPAGEKPPVDPGKIRVTPKDGFIVGSGIEIKETQLEAKNGAHARVGPNKDTYEVAFDQKGQSVKLAPPVGKWDLREGYQVRIKIKNNGGSSVTPKAWLESQKGPTNGFTAEQPIAAGATGDIVVSFIAKVPWTGITGATKTEWKPEKGTGTKFESDHASKVSIGADEKGGKQLLEVISVELEAPKVKLPDWVGKRPPVEGNWKMTFNEEFEGDSIDLTKWNIYTPNYWDKRTHFSKDNVIVEDGKVNLYFEKKRGRHNDDPEGKETDYATGFIDTYGKWVQRYGYFEARMKLPTVSGLWPAFWLMPDRGIDAGPQWKRADTGKGGMEFDIMEYLSGWGPYRYNIAFHWDGYQKGHKQTGSEEIYVNHDEEGFITTGLLWLPGKAAIYNNGVLVAQWESDRISNVPSNMMFTHVSGGWANKAFDGDSLPDDFLIDYVRCWQLDELASDVDGVQSTQPTPAAPTTKDQ